MQTQFANEYTCPVCSKKWYEPNNEGVDKKISEACSEHCFDKRSNEDLTLGELIDEFCDVKGFHHFEGDIGVERLEQVCKALGKYGHGFRFGSPLEHFLSDNSGAMEAILEWIREHDFDEWKENIVSHLPSGNYGDFDEDEAELENPAEGSCFDEQDYK